MFKSFVSQDELEQIKQRKQEEWEKNRRPDQPAGKGLESRNVHVNHVKFTSKSP